MADGGNKPPLHHIIPGSPPIRAIIDEEAIESKNMKREE